MNTVIYKCVWWVRQRSRPGRQAYRAGICALLFLSWMTASAQPSRILIIRHAEKPDDPNIPHLTEEGRQRAAFLTNWLTSAKAAGTNARPDGLYAAAPSRYGRGIRCVETLKPAAAHFGLPVQTPYRPDDYQKLARDLLSTKAMRGKFIVICWSHEELPALAGAFGATNVDKWKGEDFDGAYLLTFENGQMVFDRIKQKFKKKE